jgi:uncharacterized protein DUF3592
VIDRIGIPEILFVAAGLILVAALIAWAIRHWRRKSPEELERIRRLEVNRRGRLVTGQILDFVEPPPGKPGPRLITYKYQVAGVAYEAAQDLSALPNVVTLARRATGQYVNFKYDPQRPTNSILACEEWSGVPELAGRAKPSEEQLRASDKRAEQS